MWKVGWIGIVLAATVASAQNGGDLVGSYSGSLEHGDSSYEARMAIRPSADGYQLRLQVRGLGTKTLSATRESAAKEPAAFTRGQGPRSLTGSLLNAEGGQWASLDLCPTQAGWSGTYSDSKGFRATLSLTREQRAVVFYSTFNADEVAYMSQVAREVAKHYEDAGYASSVAVGTGSSLEVLSALEEAGAQGRPYSRVVIVSHAAWDGPFLSDGSVPGNPGQITTRPMEDDFDSSDDPTYTFWPRFVAAVKSGTTSDARIYAAGCHSGGSNRFERAEFHELGDAVNAEYSWTREVARATGRTVAGPMGTSNLRYSRRQTLAALEGQGTVMQETRWTSPRGERTLRPRARLDDTPLIAVPALTPISANTPQSSDDDDGY